MAASRRVVRSNRILERASCADATKMLCFRFFTFNQMVSNGDIIGGPSSSPFFGMCVQRDERHFVTLRVQVWVKNCKF
jgi:hypothetical protein